jgi:hypothetical protein
MANGAAVFILEHAGKGRGAIVREQRLGAVGRRLEPGRLDECRPLRAVRSRPHTEELVNGYVRGLVAEHFRESVP